MLEYTTWYAPELEARLALAEWRRNAASVVRPAQWRREANAIARATKVAGRPHGLRARSASNLARLALALHRDAANGAGLRPKEDRAAARLP